MPSVIKANQTASIRPNITTIGLVDHLAEANSLLEQARGQAREIIARAEKEANEESHRVFARARELGHAVGFKKGQEEGRATGHEQAHRESMDRFQQENEHTTLQMQRAIDALDDMIVHTEAARKELQQRAEEHLLEFAVQLASKLTFAIGVAHKQTVEENLRRCISLVASKTDVVVRVHPDDLDCIQRYAPSVVRRVADAPHVTITADESLARGGCVVESGRCEIDASLETQVYEMVRQLIGTETRDV